MENNPVSKTKRSARKVTFTVTFGLIAKLIIASAVVAILVVTYNLGDTHGAARQKDADAKNRTTSLSPGESNLTNNFGLRFSAIGTITDINSKQVKLKDSRGKEQTALLNKETVVTGKDGKKTDIKALQKDQKIIITGTKTQKDDVQTATRIRIQS